MQIIWRSVHSIARKTTTGLHRRFGEPDRQRRQKTRAIDVKCNKIILKLQTNGQSRLRWHFFVVVVLWFRFFRSFFCRPFYSRLHFYCGFWCHRNWFWMSKHVKLQTDIFLLRVFFCVDSNASFANENSIACNAKYRISNLFSLFFARCLGQSDEESARIDFSTVKVVSNKFMVDWPFRVLNRIACVSAVAGRYSTQF